MTPGAVRLLRIGVVVVPLGALLLVLHLISPSLREKWHEGRLPVGYERIARFEPFVLYARPENRAAPPAARILAEFSRRAVAEYGDALGLKTPETEFHVFVFSNDRDLAEYTRRELGSDYEFNGGFYLPWRNALGVVGEAAPEEIVRPLFHEGTHLLLDAAGPRADWSLWLQEGLACFFEASAMDSDGGIERLGGLGPRVRERASRYVQTGQWVAVEDLLAAAPTVWSGEDNWRYYVTTALLVHALLRGDLREEYGERFLAYVRREREPGEIGADEFRARVGEPAVLDFALRRAVQRW